MKFLILHVIVLRRPTVNCWWRSKWCMLESEMENVTISRQMISLRIINMVDQAEIWLFINDPPPKKSPIMILGSVRFSIQVCFMVRGRVCTCVVWVLSPMCRGQRLILGSFPLLLFTLPFWDSLSHRTRARCDKVGCSSTLWSIPVCTLPF